VDGGRAAHGRRRAARHARPGAPRDAGRSDDRDAGRVGAGLAPAPTAPPLRPRPYGVAPTARSASLTAATRSSSARCDTRAPARRT
jgi:hypothetical protein